ncbi:MAG: hypothetical protein RLZZ387_349 [Chloroflexota bacterium]
MQRCSRFVSRPVLLLLALLLAAACAAPPRLETVATGLSQPRGMVLAPSGDLIVAEAGAPDLEEEAAPVSINESGRVSRVSSAGQVTPLVERLPFTHDVASGTDVGPADVALLGGTLYVLTAEGHAPLSRMLLRVAPGEPPQQVASFLAFALNDNLFGKMMGGAGVQANPFGLAAAPDGSAFYVSDGASGRVLKVTLDGQITVFAEVPKMPPLTGLTFGPDGRLYVTVFSVLPHTPGTGALWAADMAGGFAPVAEGLTMPIDVGFDPKGALYVLEFGDGRSPREPYAGQGRLLRVGSGGERSVVLDRLDHPTSMLFSPGGDLFIALSGAFSGAGEGSIVRVRCEELRSCQGG